MGYNTEAYIVGPFVVDYERFYTIINDAKGNIKKVDFSGIGITNGTQITSEKAIRVYDQNGELVNPSSWRLVYTNRYGIENRESYSEYPMPYPNEEFWIRIERKGNEDLLGIKKIEVQYYEMQATAQYAELIGDFSTLRWEPGAETRYCDGGSKCPHGYTVRHAVGHTYYLSADVEKAGQESQPLIEILEASRKYKNDYIQKLKFTTSENEGEDSDDTILGFTVDLSGNIWNDDNEIISDGIKSEDEKGIEGIEIFLYEDGTNKFMGKTITDKDGNYEFSKLPIPNGEVYYITYTYDGQTYKTTKSFAKGSKQDYITDKVQDKYEDISILDETETVRQELNNRFNIITEKGAIEAKGQTKPIKLEYTESANGEISTLKTTNSDGTVKEEFKITVSSKANDICFPIKEHMSVDGEAFYSITDNRNINIGLSEREKVDANLKLDVYQSTFTIKGQEQSFLHSGKDIRNKYSNLNPAEYMQEVNPADYNWKISNYEDKGLSAEEVKEILGENSELEVYVEYMIIVRNSGGNNIVFIEELADYYDKNLIYSPMYGDKHSSWVQIRNEDETESNYSGGERKYITWSNKSEYGDTNEYDKAGFNKIYTDLGEYGIQNGQYLEIHLVFKVAKDEKGNIKLDSEEGKQNAVEVNAYRSEQNGKTAGLIDLDSKPGDLNPTETINYQDDEDRAPDYKLKLGYSNGDTGGSGAKGEDDPGSGGTGNSGKVDTDINGNPIGYGNTIEGNVWEDIKTITIEEDNRKISNGIKEDTIDENWERIEKLIDNIKVELVEIIGNYEIVLDTVRTGKELLLSDVIEVGNERDKVTSIGAYRFSGLASGKYKIRFIYGDKEQLEKDLTYNGQDYQALSSANIINRDKTEELLSKTYEDTEIMIVIDNSNSMLNAGKMEQAKQFAQELLTNIHTNLPGVKLGVVNFNEIATTIGKVGTAENALSIGINELVAGGETAIAKGILEAKKGYGEEKNKLMIIITDGQETVEIEERVIEQIESLKALGIKLTTVLTGNSENIFGTTDNPRYGTVFSIANVTTNEAEMEKGYQEILMQSEIEKDRSLGQDIEGAEIEPEAGTRRWQINEYKEMTYKKGSVLDIEGIELLEGEERTDAITDLANTTWMKSETKEVEFRANNIGADQIHEVNQALVKRPIAELQLREEIAAIKVMLSDGTVIIDTAKGLSKNVMGLDIPEATVSVYMDEEIMQGATIEVAYKLVIENVGEIDRLSNYFEGASDETITTRAEVIYAYINENIVYRQENQTEGSNWTRVELPTAQKDAISEETQDVIQKGTKIALRTDVFKEVELYPVSSKEVRTGQGTSQTAISQISTDLILSKLISPESDEDSSLTYDCAMEVTVRGNEVGRRVLGSIPGNLGGRIEAIDKLKENGAHITLEAEEGTSRRIIITKPLGEDRSNKQTLIALAGFTVLALVSLGLKGRKKK